MILYITRKFPPSVGGMQKLSYKMITNLAKITNVHLISWGGSQLFLPFFVIYALVKAIVVLATSRDVALIHAGDVVIAPLGVLLKCIYRLPVVTTAHGLDIAFGNPLYRLLITPFLRRVDGIICISSYIRDYCMREGISAEKCVTIPVGVDVDEFQSQSSWTAKEDIGGARYENLKGAITLLTVGRLVERKGVAHFISLVLPKLIAAKPNIHYVVVGEGPQRRRIEAVVKTLKLNEHVSLLGWVADEEVKKLYRVADLFIMPNIPVPGDVEGFGIVALEACAAGLCVVASDLEGIKQAIIPGRNGFLIKPYDTLGYTSKILELLDNEPARRKLGDKAKAFVEANYNWTGIALQYLKLFEDIAGRKLYQR